MLKQTCKCVDSSDKKIPDELIGDHGVVTAPNPGIPMEFAIPCPIRIAKVSGNPDDTAKGNNKVEMAEMNPKIVNTILKFNWHYIEHCKHRIYIYIYICKF